MLQILLFLIVFIAIIFPMGIYLYHIAVGKHTFADPVFDRVDNGIYRICGIDKKTSTNHATKLSKYFSNCDF